MMVPLTLEVPYLDGLAQEGLPDRLIPASLYGLAVLRPPYTAEAIGPKSITATKTVVDSGRAYTNYITDGDVEVYQDHNCYVGQSPQCETEGLFTCSHPGCVGVEGFGAYFASTEQFMVHWNTFHVPFHWATTARRRGATIAVPPFQISWTNSCATSECSTRPCGDKVEGSACRPWLSRRSSRGTTPCTGLYPQREGGRPQLAFVACCLPPQPRWRIPSSRLGGRPVLL